MLVRVHYGASAGQVLDFPFHVATALVEAGRASRVEGEGAGPSAAVAVATPDPAHADPLPASPRSSAARPRRRPVRPEGA